MRQLSSDCGSVAPLGIGVAFVLLVSLLTVVSASSVFLQQRRLGSIADATALYARKHMNDASSRIDESRLKTLVDKALEMLPEGHGVSVASARLPDGTTLVIRLCQNWQSPVMNPLGASQAVICVESAARPF